MEAEWMKSIQSSTICNFFYAFYLGYLIFFIITVTLLIYIFMNVKGRIDSAGIYMATQLIVLSGLEVTMMLFFYILCDRSIVEKFLSFTN